MKKIIIAYAVFIILVGLFAILFFPWGESNQIGRYHNPDQFPVPVGWKTYTNPLFGYMISFPKYVIIRTPSQPNSTQVETSNDQIISFFVEGEGIYGSLIVVQVETEWSAKGFEELKSLFKKNYFPNYLIDYPEAQESDFELLEIFVDQRSALKIETPEVLIIQVPNDRGEIISLTTVANNTGRAPYLLLEMAQTLKIQKDL